MGRGLGLRWAAEAIPLLLYCCGGPFLFFTDLHLYGHLLEAAGTLLYLLGFAFLPGVSTEPAQDPRGNRMVAMVLGLFLSLWRPVVLPVSVIVLLWALEATWRAVRRRRLRPSSARRGAAAGSSSPR